MFRSRGVRPSKSTPGENSEWISKLTYLSLGKFIRRDHGVLRFAHTARHDAFLRETWERFPTQRNRIWNCVEILSESAALEGKTSSHGHFERMGVKV